MTTRLFNGDCLPILKTLPDACADVVLTSPPYYAAIDYGHPNQIGLELDPSDYIGNLVLCFMELLRVCTKDAIGFIVLNDTRVTNFSNAREASFWSSKSKADAWPRNSGAFPPNTMKHNKWGVPLRALLAIPQRLTLALHEIGWYLKAEIVWDKETNRVINSLSPIRSHESILVISRDTRRRVKGNSIIRLPSRGNESNHPASFPIALAQNILERVEYDTVIDPFMGNGTTGIEAVRTGHSFIGIEIKTEHYNASCERIGNLASQETHDPIAMD